MKPSSLSNALISYLASRSHDWKAWQIEENNENLKLSVLYSPHNDTQWKVLSQKTSLSANAAEFLLNFFSKIEKGQGTFADSLPQAELDCVRNSLGLGKDL